MVTFTNAATQELRDRIRSRLAQAAAFFRHQEPGDDFLISLGESCEVDAWPGNARLLDQAAQWMDEAAIFTIHSWSQRMLKRYAFGSGSLFDLELAPGEDQLMEQAACDYWRSTFYPLPASQLAMVLNTLSVTTPRELLAKVRPFMVARHPELPREPREILEQRESAIATARQCWASDFDHVANLVRRARREKHLNGNKYREASLEKWLKGMQSWIAGKCELPDEKALMQLSRSGLEAGKSKKGVVPEHAAFDALDELNTALKDLDLERTLYIHGASEIKARVDQEKRRQALVGFDDLLSQLEQAIHRPGNEHLARMIRQQFPVALVDEFQDTDPVQYATLGTIYLDQPDTGFFMIGDPKQAIYAFRGADIHTYLLARRDAAARLYTLDTNYRSAGDMVAAVNYFFGLATTHEQGPFLFADEIPFAPVKARGREDRFFVQNEFPCPLTLWKENQSEPITKTGDKGYIHHMAEACAGEIVRLLNLAALSPPQCGFKDQQDTITPLTPGDMAILVRNKTEAAAVRQALDNRGVRTVYLSDKRSVFDSSEALDLLYLLRACASPDNAGYIKAALGTTLLDLSFEFLDNLSMDELAWEAEVERFRNYHLTWHHNGVLPMVRALLRDFKVPARLLASAMGERALTNVLHLAELVQAKAISLDGEHAVIRWFTRQLETPDTSSDEGILRLESDEQLVKVVTIHKSKGLEYPLVFLPFICSHRKVSTGKSPVFWHDEQGHRQVGINPGDTAMALAAREALAEDLRLLYVAMTRACHACFLGMGIVGRVLKKGETNEFHCSGIGHVITGGEEKTTRDILQLLDDMGKNCSKICVTPAPECPDMLQSPDENSAFFAPARHFSHPGWQRWFITSYSGIADGATMPDIHVPEGTGAMVDSPDSARADQLMEAEFEPVIDSAIISPARSIHTFARGPEPGTFLHDLFEWAADQGFDTVARNPGTIQEHLALVCPRHGWEEWEETLSNWFHQLLLTPLHLDPGADPCMCLSDLDRNACHAEMEFMFSATHVDTTRLDRAVTGALLPGVRRPVLKWNRINGMLKGFMDLVFVVQDKYYVMDYKSNYLGEGKDDYTRQAMGDAMISHRYDLQLVLYTLALHRLLKSRLPDYNYDIHVGGAVYLFLRGVDGTGNGVYGERPPRELMEKLDRMFTGKHNEY